MASALQIVPTLKKASGTQLHIDLKAAPANDNDPVVQSIRKAWEDREQLSLLVKEVTETSIWQGPYVSIYAGDSIGIHHQLDHKYF